MKLPPHVEQEAIVLDDVRVLYVPIPKAGSTAVLWSLVDHVELEPGAFARSTKLEMTRALTIHDPAIWGRAHRLEGRAPEARRIFDAPDWLAFTVVRDPVQRLWSAWVSKVLVRDPRFVAFYGSAPWFPEPPQTAEEVVRAFRKFVAALADRPVEWDDPHWSSQAELSGVDQLGYDLVARVEGLPGELDAVGRHLRRYGRDDLRLRRENPSLLTFSSGLLDAETWDCCATLTARDRMAFGYEMPERGTGSPSGEWLAGVELRLPGIHAVVERNERIGDLKRLLPRKRAS